MARPVTLNLLGQAGAAAVVLLAVSACQPASQPATKPLSTPAQAAPAGEEDRPLPTLEAEMAAKRERDLQKARASGLPTLEEEIRARQARESKTPIATPATPATPAAPAPAEATPPAEVPAAAPPSEPPAPPVSADTFRPPWWVEVPVERDGRVSGCGLGEAATLVEARRAAIDQARAALRAFLGPSGEIPEAPQNTTAVHLPDGRYRAFVLIEARR